MSSEDKILLKAFAALVIFFVLFGLFVQRSEAQKRTDCEERGGIYTRSGCMEPEALADSGTGGANG
jgi:hypothetical protein